MVINDFRLLFNCVAKITTLTDSQTIFHNFNQIKNPAPLGGGQGLQHQNIGLDFEAAEFKPVWRMA
jgi:hypothetical protein